MMPFNIEFISGESIGFSFSQFYELLQQNFVIHPQHIIPTGEYTFWRYEMELSTARRRRLFAAADIETGSFFTGNRTQYDVELGWKIGVPLLIGVAYEHNDVSLKTGDFTTDVTRLNFNILFSPDVFLYNYLQYDNLSERLGWQSRFVWILKPGREIFFVWESLSQDPFERFEISENSTRLKLKYTIRF
jgi:hypothetical protein